MDNFEQSETPHQNLWTDGDSNPRPPHCPDNFGGTIIMDPGRIELPLLHCSDCKRGPERT